MHGRQVLTTGNSRQSRNSRSENCGNSLLRVTKLKPRTVEIQFTRVTKFKPRTVEIHESHEIQVQILTLSRQVIVMFYKRFHISKLQINRALTIAALLNFYMNVNKPGNNIYFD